MKLTLGRKLAAIFCGVGMICIAMICAGCEVDAAERYMTDVRKENGLVIILPGIEGESEFNHNIRRGLVSAGSYRAMPIYNWGRPIPGLGMLLNQMDVIGNRAAGRRIAQMIEQYEDAYPGRPVYIIGHSGGGGVAVFAAEELSKDYKIDGLVLIAASISDNYNLNKALKSCRNGIVNFYNPEDAGLLGVGTTVMGNVDGGHGPSAGLNGFNKNYNNLYQVKVTESMTAASGGGSHDAATRPRFVATYVAPWVLSSRWPPSTLASYNPYR
ncbi:MAG TPA: alpha/beta hydrolase [Phycisphaerae bacterium]|nr:alpha/beta hydrolase [Phycisphaerae bacterium]HPS53798.1 alpha/beta hydrolase [Phycisphaerae bacterium]